MDSPARLTPHRYQLAKGIVIDADGKESHYIDVIVYDRQYTPLVFNKTAGWYIPAESVYGVLEAKQELNRVNIIYAGKKAASVRRLRRTAAPIVHAGGKIDNPKEPFRIIAGIITYRSSWTPAFGNSLQKTLGVLTKNQRLEFGIVPEDGYFEVDYSVGAPTVNIFKTTRALAAFIIRLLAHFQSLGTVSAIDYEQDPKVLDE